MAHPTPPRSIAPAAADAINLGLRLHRAGKVAEAFRALERAVKLQPGNPAVLWQVGRVLRQMKQSAQALPLLRKAVELRPANPEPLLDLALACLDTHQPDAAVAHLEGAVALKPDWADAWSALGYAQGKARRFAEAESTLRHALTLQPDHAETHNRLGIVFSGQGRPERAVECHLKAIELSPGSLPAWSNLGMALEAQNKVAAAAAAYEQALAIDPKNPTVKYNLGIARLTNGELRRDVWLKYEFRWVVLRENPQRNFAQPYWRGEPLTGKSILIYAEQGLGDTLQFVRYAAVLADQGATVHVEVQPPLKALLADLPGATSVIAKGEPLPPFDFHCPLLSLPFAVNTRLETIPAALPYVHAAPDRRAIWAQRLGAPRGLRVGIVWRGNPRHTNDANRSMPLATFRGLLAAPGCEFVSLQIKPTEAESAILSAQPSVVDPTEQVADFGDTAAIIAELDVVLAVDTSVAHLAGAMGKPVWLLLPFAPDWRWMLDRPDSPWYPNMRLFRQSAVGDWSAVTAEVATALETASAARIAA
jgi:Flp pilus assembly protein TadD